MKKLNRKCVSNDPDDFRPRSICLTVRPYLKLREVVAGQGHTIEEVLGADISKDVQAE